MSSQRREIKQRQHGLLNKGKWLMRKTNAIADVLALVSSSPYDAEPNGRASDIRSTPRLSFAASSNA